jgi:stringent starvation protein B
MPPTQPLPPKKDVALALLERSSVYVHLDPRPPAVGVPAWFKKQPQLVLQIGLNMPVPIPDLRLDDDGLSCTLSFNRNPFFCVVPWASVFAMVGDDGRGMVWPDDVPAEVARQAQVRVIDGGAEKETPRQTLARAPKADAQKAKRPRKRPILAAVSDADGRDGAVKPAKSSRSAERTAHANQAAAQRPVAAAPAPRGSRKRKRELPPYLRVVK